MSPDPAAPDPQLDGPLAGTTVKTSVAYRWFGAEASVALFLLVRSPSMVIIAALIAPVLPLPQVVVEERGLGAWRAVRRSWALTRGTRLPAFVAVLVLEVVCAVPAVLSWTLSAAGGSGWFGPLALEVLKASLVDSFVLLAPPVACSLLRREKDGPAAGDLGMIFE